MLRVFFRVKTSDLPPPPKLSSLPISISALRLSVSFPALEDTSRPATVAQDAPRFWGSCPHLPYLAESRARAAGSAFGAVLVLPAHKVGCESPLLFGGTPKMSPPPARAPLGWAEPAAARIRWRSRRWPRRRRRRQGDITRTASARSLFQHMPWALHNLAFQISVISFSGKIAALPAFRREGRVGKEKPEETRLLCSFSSPFSGMPPLLSNTDLRPPCSCLSLHPHNKVMSV